MDAAVPWWYAMLNHSAPPPSLFAHLRPTNTRGALIVTAGCLVTGLAMVLSARAGWLGWALGQTALAIVLVHWFTVLHEAGHRTLFRSRRLNTVAGYLAGFVAIIPFRTWVRVHGRHHKWTGWQDLDPTAAGLVRDDLSQLQRTIVNVCWRCWIPLFSILYRLENYWNLRRLGVMFPGRDDRAAMLVNASLQLASYALVIVLLGPWFVLNGCIGGLVLSLMLEDLLLLSQHTQVPVQLSHGHTVSPVPAIEQATFTRSLRLPPWVSALLLHFDAHELHHMYPFVPGYHLRRVPYQPPNEIGWFAWLRASKRIDGVALLFQLKADH
jgi:omega-6 fatty acid desaturase (delta-12 desaturase)